MLKGHSSIWDCWMTHCNFWVIFLLLTGFGMLIWWFWQINLALNKRKEKYVPVHCRIYLILAKMTKRITTMIISLSRNQRNTALISFELIVSSRLWFMQPRFHIAQTGKISVFRHFYICTCSQCFSVFRYFCISTYVLIRNVFSQVHVDFILVWLDDAGTTLIRPSTLYSQYAGIRESIWNAIWLFHSSTTALYCHPVNTSQRSYTSQNINPNGHTRQGSYTSQRTYAIY